MAEQAVGLGLAGQEAVRLRDGERLFLHGHRNLHAERFRAREHCATVALDPVRERELRLPVGAQAQAQPRRDTHLARIDGARVQRGERTAQPRPHVGESVSPLMRTFTGSSTGKLRRAPPSSA